MMHPRLPVRVSPGTMLLRLLLLLTLLGPGNSLQLWDSKGERAQEASGPAPLRGRRQAGENDEFEDPDYPQYVTDPPELLENITNAVATNSEALITMSMMEKRASVRPGTPEPATVKAATTGSAGTGAGGAVVGKLSTEPVTQQRLATVEMTTQPAVPEAETTQPVVPEAGITQPAVPEAGTTQPAVPEAGTTQPAVPEAGTNQPAVPEAGTNQPAVPEAGTTQPAVPEAGTTQPADPEAGTNQPAVPEAGTNQPAVPEAGTTQPAVTEAGTTQPAVTEAETTQLPRKSKAVKVLFTESVATETLSTVPVTMKFLSTEPTKSVIFLGPSVAQEDTTLASNNFPDISMKKGQIVTPGSSVAPSPTGSSDLIPVRQCLLAILILALLATIFLVCTVVLAVRLSRKNHMYPVRNYSPTEMVCISSLLPDGGEGPAVTANGGLSKSHGLKAELSEDRDGDDLTLHSFLP